MFGAGDEVSSLAEKRVPPYAYLPTLPPPTPPPHTEDLPEWYDPRVAGGEHGRCWGWGGTSLGSAGLMEQGQFD